MLRVEVSKALLLIPSTRTRRSFCASWSPMPQMPWTRSVMSPSLILTRLRRSVSFKWKDCFRARYFTWFRYNHTSITPFAVHVPQLCVHGVLHLHAILTARVVGDARYEVMQRQTPKRCSWCNSDVPSPSFHGVWECSFFSENQTVKAWARDAATDELAWSGWERCAVQGTLILHHMIW